MPCCLQLAIATFSVRFAALSAESSVFSRRSGPGTPSQERLAAWVDYLAFETKASLKTNPARIKVLLADLICKMLAGSPNCQIDAESLLSR